MSTGFLTGAVFNVFTDALISVVLSPIFIVFLIIVLGYLLGRINIKGVSFGSSGVFIVAIVVGIVLYAFRDDLVFTKFVGVSVDTNESVFEKIGLTWVNGTSAGSTITAVKNIGLALFVTSIGFVAGPSFIRNFKKKAFSYIAMGIAAVITPTVLCLIFLAIDKNLSTASALGLMMGGLSSTPGLTSATDVLPQFKEVVAAASGLAYPFGVLGVVFFVQLMPKILRKDIAVEVQKLRAGFKSQVVSQTTAQENGVMAATPPKKRLIFDSLGLCMFGAAVALGMILGAITIPLGSTAKFALGTTGGCLIVALLFGHFGHAGSVSLEVPKTTLNPLKELGLVLFLAASGVEGGLAFLKNFAAIQLVYGALFTIIPMIVAYFIGRYAFKLELLNNLGSVCGAMTSTPALGALVYVSKTDDVAQSYAATYPISLFLLVLAPQVINLIFPMG